MRKSHSGTIFCIACIAGFLGCNEPLSDAPLASYNGTTLYASEVQRNVATDKLSPHDSAESVAAYIRQWKLNQVMLEKANKNLSDEEKDVSHLLEEYRQSLLLFRYQQKLVQERVDTQVSESEMRAYFSSHPHDFSITHPIVRIKFVKLPAKSSALNRVKKLLTSDEMSTSTELFSYCARFAEKYYLDDETWLLLDEVKKEIPIETYDDEHFLKNNRFVQIAEGNSVYLLKIIAYRVRNDRGEFAFEKENIRQLIIQQRKQAFLKQVESDLLLNMDTK